MPAPNSRTAPHAFSAATDLWPGFFVLRRPDNPSPQKQTTHSLPHPDSPHPRLRLGCSGPAQPNFVCFCARLFISLPVAMEQHILIPLLLTLGAGLATGIGSAVAFFARHTNKRLLAFSLGLSGGVMIYVSFVELLGQAETALAASWSARTAQGIAVAAFFAGILLIGIIDRLVPSFENPHEARTVEEMDRKPKNTRLMRMGVMTALAITIHNFPEGIATFTTALENRTLGVAIAAAVAIHNIPEGIAVSIPIFYATGNRGKAFRYSLLSGLAEPLGALLAWLVLTPFMSPTLMGCVLAGVAGIMVFISIDELLPAAREYGEAHVAIYGVVSGMAVMAASLLLLA